MTALSLPHDPTDDTNTPRHRVAVAALGFRDQALRTFRLAFDGGLLAHGAPEAAALATDALGAMLAEMTHRIGDSDVAARMLASLLVTAERSARTYDELWRRDPAARDARRGGPGRAEQPRQPIAAEARAQAVERPGTAWQDIASHPGDHFICLVWSPLYGRIVAFCDVAGKWWACPAGPEPLPSPPTHWQPLPPPPDSAGWDDEWEALDLDGLEELV